MAANTQSQIFSWRRYVQVLRHDLTLNGKSLALKCLMMLAVTTLAILISTWPHDVMKEGHIIVSEMPGNLPYQLFVTLKFCSMIFCCLGASLFMENMAKPGTRLNSLMLPASTLEKYAVRWTICVVGVAVAFAIAYTLGDLIRVLIIYCYFPDIEGNTFVGLWGALPMAERWWLPVTALLTAQATYVLGSTLWPKHSFLKTFGAMFVISIILSIIFSTVSLHAMANWHINKSIGAEDIEILMKKAWIVGSSVWTVFCYVISYMRVRESEIIDRW